MKPLLQPLVTSRIGIASGIAKLKQEVASFFHRLAGTEKRPETASR
jgi:hypothetical protein